MDEHVRSYEVVSQFISSAIRKILRAFAATIVPKLSQATTDTWKEFENIFENMLRQRPANIRRLLAIFLHVIQWSSLIRYGRPFSSLDFEQRTKFLGYFHNNWFQLVRSGFWGLMTLCFSGNYGQGKVARAIGYLPDSRGWEALK